MCGHTCSWARSSPYPSPRACFTSPSYCIALLQPARKGIHRRCGRLIRPSRFCHSWSRCSAPPSSRISRARPTSCPSSSCPICCSSSLRSSIRESCLRAWELFTAAPKPLRSGISRFLSGCLGSRFCCMLKRHIWCWRTTRLCHWGAQRTPVRLKSPRGCLMDRGEDWSALFSSIRPLAAWAGMWCFVLWSLSAGRRYMASLRSRFLEKQPARAGIWGRRMNEW